jgi:hypothetical protein
MVAPPVVFTFTVVGFCVRTSVEPPDAVPVTD